MDTSKSRQSKEIPSTIIKDNADIFSNFILQNFNKCIIDGNLEILIWRVLEKKNPGRIQKSNSNSSTLDKTIMVYKDHGPCNLTTFNQTQLILNFSGTKEKHVLYPQLHMLVLLCRTSFIHNINFLKQLYHQHGETLPKQNTTIH